MGFEPTDPEGPLVFGTSALNRTRPLFLMEHRVRVELTRASLQPAGLPIAFRCLAGEEGVEPSQRVLEARSITVWTPPWSAR